MNLYKKKYSIHLFVFLILTAIGISSCHSLEEKSDEAYEQAKISQEFTDDSLDMETEAELAPLLSTKPMKVVVVDSWTNYAKEMEKEIQLNEKIIAKLRATIGSDTKEFKKIAAMEKNNLELHNRLIEYENRMDADLEKFKSDWKDDLIELEKDLEDFSTVVETEKF